MAHSYFRQLRHISVFILSSASITCFASGAFNPSAPGPVDAKFTLGKSIILGRKGDADCAGCHTGNKKFKRNKLQKLGKPISELLTDCGNHDPCFSEGQEKSLSSEDLAGIDSYFKRRYRLKQ